MYETTNIRYERVQNFRVTIPQLVDSFLPLMGSWIERNLEVSSKGQMAGKLLIPKVALREGIVNALVHRKYFIPGSIKVALFEDRLEIFSPGGLPGLIDIKNLGDGTTFLRNPNIAKIARKYKLIEKLGTGIKLIYDSCRKEGLKQPVFNENGDFVKITYFFEEEIEKTLSDEDKIIQIGKAFNEIRIKDLVERIGFYRNTATRKMNALIKKGYFERKGKGAGTYFIYIGK